MQNRQGLQKLANDLVRESMSHDASRSILTKYEESEDDQTPRPQKEKKLNRVFMSKKKIKYQAL